MKLPLAPSIRRGGILLGSIHDAFHRGSNVNGMIWLLRMTAVLKLQQKMARGDDTRYRGA